MTIHPSTNRILVIGATGMLGHKVWQRLSGAFPEVFATMRSAHADFAGLGLFDPQRVVDRLDLMDSSSLLRTLNDIGPAAIVNCAAVTKRRGESSDPLASIELNSALPHRLAKWARSNRARLIHFSTDCVFDGRTGGYDETSSTSADDLYGRTKALGEVDGQGSLTLRTSLIGREIRGRTELLEWFLSQGGQVIHGFRRALYTGVSTLWMADLVADLLVRFGDLSGVYHVAAPVISKYELLLLARDAFGVDVEIDPDDSVVMLRNLDGARFHGATGIAVPHWREMITALAADPTPYDQWRSLDAA